MQYAPTPNAAGARGGNANSAFRLPPSAFRPYRPSFADVLRGDWVVVLQRW